MASLLIKSGLLGHENFKKRHEWLVKTYAVIFYDLQLN